MSIKIGIVVSKFNEEITENLFKSTVIRLEQLNISSKQLKTIWVPGAIEIPVTAKQLILTNQYQAIICLGAVIRGETSHFDYVCYQVSYGCQKLAIEHTIPIIFGVLTTENVEQALARSNDDENNKGREAAETAIAMINILEGIKSCK